MSRFARLAGLLVVAALAAAVTCGVLAQRATTAADARADALAAARTRLPTLLTYHQRTLKDDLGLALEQTTGEFTQDYRKILTEIVEPTATSRGISTEASVSAAGVVSGDREKVVVLVFLTQTTTAKGDRASVSGSRVEVTMERVGEAWKVAGLKPV